MNLKALTITQAVEATGLPRNTIYRLLEEGQLAGNRCGNRWYISAASLDAWVNRKPEPPVVDVPTRIDAENPFL